MKNKTMMDGKKKGGGLVISHQQLYIFLATEQREETVWEKVQVAESVQTLDVDSLGSLLLSCRDEWRWQMSWEGVGVGRRLSDSSRELEEGVGGWGVGAGQTNSILLPWPLTFKD